MKLPRCYSRLVMAAALLLPTVLTAQEARKQEPAPPENEVSEHLRKTPLKDAPRGLKLPAGYEHKGEMDFEGTIWGEIWKKGGLQIKYLHSPVYGQIVKPQDKDSYLKYWEQVVNGRVVRFAFTKGKYLLISVPLDDTPDTINSATFSTKVEKPEDAADMVTMALSLLREGKPGEK
ncbi:MAG: hypothetical protein LC800_01675 [Acidobacteria bacterium]|nr:hypothetical protein [Acidobacteriota bacterium]